MGKTAKEIILRTIFQFKRGQSTAWTERNPVLRPGEPGFELNTGLLKIGNGETAWNDLPYYGQGDYSISPDGNSLQINQDGKLTLYGYEDAELEQIPIVNANGKIGWANIKDILKVGNGLTISTDGTVSISDLYTQEILSLANEAADRASQSAIVAGNYAAEAIQAKIDIDRKIWYGTMEEYNALPSVSSSTIYIILHE